MKRLLLSLVALLGFSLVSSAQCGEELMKAALTAMGSHQYIKDFEIKLPKGNTEGVKFTVVLNSRTLYQVNIANGESNAENVIVKLYDGERLMGTNHANGKTATRFQAKIGKTAAYKMVVTTPDGSEACARAVLSLVTQFTDAEM